MQGSKVMPTVPAVALINQSIRQAQLALQIGEGTIRPGNVGIEDAFRDILHMGHIGACAVRF